VIKVDPKPMSDELRAKFEAKVRIPGERWLAENTPGEKKRLPGYWLEVRDELADAFHERCAYTAMWLSHPGQVDHFVSVDEDRSKAYDWNNLRYCAGWLNSCKQGLRSTQIIDPLAVEDGWFEITLPDLQLRVTEQCPEHLRARAELMLDRLKLRNGAQVIRFRRQFYAQYKPEDPSTLARLDAWAPLIARAIRKQMAQTLSPDPR
jgi:hypothetical protein